MTGGLRYHFVLPAGVSPAQLQAWRDYFAENGQRPGWRDIITTAGVEVRDLRPAESSAHSVWQKIQRRRLR